MFGSKIFFLIQRPLLKSCKCFCQEIPMLGWRNISWDKPSKSILKISRRSQESKLISFIKAARSPLKLHLTASALLTVLTIRMMQMRERSWRSYREIKKQGGRLVGAKSSRMMILSTSRGRLKISISIEIRVKFQTRVMLVPSLKVLETKMIPRIKRIDK